MDFDLSSAGSFATPAAPADQANSAIANGTKHLEGVNGSSTAAEVSGTDVKSSADASPSLSIDSTMQDAGAKAPSAAASEVDSSFASPDLRQGTPAISEAASETASVATSAAAEAAKSLSEAANEGTGLAFPLSAYHFADTTLVPADATTTEPFHFQVDPPAILEESWARSKRADDPEAYELPDREAGYFASPEELAASKIREEARKTKVLIRLARLFPHKYKAPDVPVPAPRQPPPQVPMSRGASRSRAMEVDELEEEAPAAPPKPRRGRPPKSALQKQVKASPEPAPAPAKKPAPASRAEPSTTSSTRPVRFTTRFLESKLVNALLPDDAQTATPAHLEPHPAFIDLLELPPHYLADGTVASPAQPAPAPAPVPSSSRAGSSTRASSSARTVVDKADTPKVTPKAAAKPKPEPAADPAPAPATPVGSRAASRAASARNTPAIEPQQEEQKIGGGDETPQDTTMADVSIAEMTGQAAGTKRTRAIEDQGGRPSRKKAREDSVASGANTPNPTGHDEDPPLGEPVDWIVQSTTCLSKKVDGQVRCFQCIARSIGHGCSFNGIRSFGVDFLGRIVTDPVFRSNPAPNDPPYYNKVLTKPLNMHDCELVKTWAAPALAKILKREYQHCAQPDTIKIHHSLSMHSLCDTCNTAQLGAQYMCKSCGRMACRVCREALIDIEKREEAGLPPKGSTIDHQRRRKCIAKKRGKEASGAEVHRSEQFVPLTTFDKTELKALTKAVTDWDRGRTLAPTEEKTYNYLRRKFTIESNLPTYDQNTYPVNTILHKDLSEPIFFEMWRMGEPILVRKIPRGNLANFTPDYLAARCANFKLDLLSNYGPEFLPSTGAYFFGQFTKPGFRRRDDGKTSYRTKDFPTPKQWKNELRELEEEFFKIIPLPNILRPDGIFNMLAHTPTNALQPDLGPRMVASWETNAKWPTTHLRTDCTDVASFMFWGGKDRNTGKPLRIRWDVFKQEDTDKLREFCWDLLTRKLAKGMTPAKYREQHDDPLLSPQLYLTKSQRAELFTRYGVKPHPIYQFEGDLVLVPAGCPYQVSSWVDHLNISVSFLGGARVKPATEINKALQKQTKERTVWRQDNVQLESQLLWAWRACSQYEKEHPDENDAEHKKPSFRGKPGDEEKKAASAAGAAAAPPADGATPATLADAPTADSVASSASTAPASAPEPAAAVPPAGPLAESAASAAADSPAAAKLATPVEAVPPSNPPAASSEAMQVNFPPAAEAVVAAPASAPAPAAPVLPETSTLPPAP
ncbi:hypothetical protein JCM8547_006572 [Rhodosporidiobolus lusitaniae]